MSVGSDEPKSGSSPFFFCRQELKPCPLDLQSSVVAKRPQGPIRLVGQLLKMEYGCPSGQESENGHRPSASPKKRVYCGPN